MPELLFKPREPLSAAESRLVDRLNQPYRRQGRGGFAQRPGSAPAGGARRDASLRTVQYDKNSLGCFSFAPEQPKVTVRAASRGAPVPPGLAFNKVRSVSDEEKRLAAEHARMGMINKADNKAKKADFGDGIPSWSPYYRVAGLTQISYFRQTSGDIGMTGPCPM